MTFTSNIFLIGLLPWFILLVYLTRKRKHLKEILLILANSIFYIWGGVGSFLYAGCFVICVWLFCKIIKCYKNKYIFFMLIIMTLIPLLKVKYTGFIIENVNFLLGYTISYGSIFVPIGISFFTFEAISLLSDVYTGKIEYEVSLCETYLYLTFFVTVVSGPIIRFHDFKRGLQNSVNIYLYNSYIERIAIGLCKKVLIADKVAILADYYFDGVATGGIYSSGGLWIGSIAYTLQLYFDFSGYTDMAIGIGGLLGFDICENFNKPYCASSIGDFWRRWHISLSSWFRDYIYIPLGGNRCSVCKHIGNLFVVWLLTGIWHGSEWTFVVWGLGYFILLVMEKYVLFLKKIGNSWIGHIYMLFCVNLLWIPFRAANLKVTQRYIAGMIGIGSSAGIEEKAVSFLPYLIVAIILCLPLEEWFTKYTQKAWFRVVKGIFSIVFVVIAICAVIDASYSPYIYGKF